jgi:hypothetical protein
MHFLEPIREALTTIYKPRTALQYFEKQYPGSVVYGGDIFNDWELLKKKLYGSKKTELEKTIWEKLKEIGDTIAGAKDPREAHANLEEILSRP